MGASLPAMAESPFALSGFSPSRSRLQAAWAGVTRPSSLLRTHAPDLDAPRAFALARLHGLRRLLRAPAAPRPFPTLSLQSLSRRLDPYPGSDLPELLLVTSRETSASRHTGHVRLARQSPAWQLPQGGMFPGCSHLLMFRLPDSLGLQIAPAASFEGRPGRLHRASPGWLPAPSCGIATCVNEQFTRLDFHQLDCSLVGCSPVPAPVCGNRLAFCWLGG